VTPLLRRDVLCIARGNRWLIEQRPPKGRWAGLWQFITIESGKATRHALVRGRPIGTVTHGLSHRRYEFRIFLGQILNSGVRSPQAPSQVPPQNPPPARAWVTLAQLDRYPLSRPHLKIAQMLGAR
jgi:adenine-specific DNA glycosylase